MNDDNQLDFLLSPHRDWIFIWKVFSRSGLATSLPSVADISVWLAESCITPAIHYSQALAMVLTLLGPALCTSVVFFLKDSTRWAMSVACCSWILDN